MTTSGFILKVIVDILFYELAWSLIRKGRLNLKALYMALKTLIWLNIMLLILGAGTHTFVNIYFMTLWFLVIFPDRIMNELTEEIAKASY